MSRSVIGRQTVSSVGEIVLKLSDGQEAIVKPVDGKFEWSQVCFDNDDVREGVYWALGLSAAEPPQCEIVTFMRRKSVP